MGGELADQPGDQAVAGGAAVAVLVERHARAARGDDERRVGDDQVEGLPRHRVEQAPLPQLGVDPVEREGETGEVEGAAGQVGRDPVCRVPGQVQRLDPAAGAEVEGALDARAGGPGGQRGRGAADAEDVVGRQRAAGRGLGEVGGDPPGVLVGAVGPQVAGGDEPAAVRPHEPEGPGADAAGAGQGGVQARGVDGQAEHEAAQQHGGGGLAALRHQGRRQRLLPVQGGGGPLAEQRREPLHRVCRPAQVGAQVGQRRGVVGAGRRRAGRRGGRESWGHPRTLARPPDVGWRVSDPR